MEESKQQHQLLLQMQHQQQMQQRQQQLFMMQHLQRHQQQQAAMSRFPNAHLAPPPGLIQTRPVNPSFHNPNVQQQQQRPMVMVMPHQQQQQEKKQMRPLNQMELQFAYQDAWRVCHPDYKRPFASLEDACERFDLYSIELNWFIGFILDFMNIQKGHSFFLKSSTFYLSVDPKVHPSMQSSFF